MEIKCIVVTPEKVVLEKSAEFVSLPLYDGDYGIASNHTPVIGRLGAGELRIKNGEKTDSYYVSGGFVEVLNNTVTLMTSRAIPTSQITKEIAEKAFADASARPASTLEEVELRNAALTDARAMKRIAEKA
ncbi:MAG: ATP synthase F1 subunit epsilon [Planctomycetia bacterium]|nr:ATP synthase F1 subunit epsilon [Planctomycetia bacterium]